MKLLNRTTYSYLLLTIPIIIITMVLFYFLIRNFNLIHVENNLKEEHKKIIRKSQYIENYYIEDELSEELLVHEIPKDSVIVDKYSTVMVYNKLEDQYEPFRQLETMQEIAGKKYRILIRKSLVENSTLVYSISIAVFVLILVMAGSFILLNRLLADSLWSPFKKIVKNLSNYHVGQVYEPQKKLNIEEFRTLDQSIQKMVQRVNKEYFIQKEFIDIVSHEYQTPLAVIANEAEQLLQSNHLKAEEMEKVSSIMQYVQRLSKMNQSLLLLSRIDNQQFALNSETNINELIKQLIQEKSNLLETKEITVKVEEKGLCKPNMNTTLATILMGNLLQNAIRYNLKQGGNIWVEIASNKISISNTGNNQALNRQLLFQKFNKSNTHKNSIGLGLHIVKAICDYCGFEVEYMYKDTHIHCFNLTLH